MKNTIKCELCGETCKTQISAAHLFTVHNMTTKEYRALGHQTLSPARLAQLQSGPIATGKETGWRGKTGPEHWNWKGGHVTRSGYRITYKNGRRDYEHRLIAEEMLGRPLNSDEVVHHKDGNRTNNSPDNLVVMKTHEHDQIKDKTKQYFHTGPDCEEAARVLRSHDWSISKISRAIRVEPRTVKAWLVKSYATPTL
jgi:hypothetical protein